MVIEKVHGLQATTLSLNERFTLLGSIAPAYSVTKPRRRRAPAGGIFNMTNENLIEQITQRLQQQTKKKPFHQRLGYQGLRRFGSESSLPGLRRANSLSNLSLSSFNNRVPWRQSNGNLRRAASFSSLPTGARRWRRGARARGLTRSSAGGQQMVGRFNGQRGRRRGAGRGDGGGRRGAGGPGPGARGAPAARGRGQARGGVVTRQQKTTPTKEELDLQLDQYMASTKSALDKELDEYMKNAIDIE